MAQVRIIRGLLSAAERRAIDWLIPRLPARTTPDSLTAFGVFGAALALAGYVLSNVSTHWLWLSNLGIVIHWFGDSLDGNLARFRKTERPRYGYFLDQTVDVLSNFMICVGLGLTSFIDMRVALLTLSGYHMASIYVFVRANVLNDFYVTVGGIGPTELRLVLLILNLSMMIFGPINYTVAGFTFSGYDLSTSLFALGFMIMFIYKVAELAPRLRAEDDAARAARQEAAKQERASD